MLDRGDLYAGMLVAWTRHDKNNVRLTNTHTHTHTHTHRWHTHKHRPFDSNHYLNDLLV